MPSPFPGVDPYIEDQSFWRDFHTRFITYCSDSLSESLPVDYVARIEERFYLVEAREETGRQYLPDVAIVKESPFPSGPSASSVTLTLEPVTVPHKEVATEEVRERWLEVRRSPDWEVITAIELLSPTNKSATGQRKYLEKRIDFLQRSVHLVEIDLLLGGLRLPMARPLPAGDHFALVTRAERLPDCDVYAWSIRRPLPTIPIPLRSPDLDVTLDLAAVFAAAYARGRYARLIDYKDPLSLPIRPDDRSWVRERAEVGVTSR